MTKKPHAYRRELTLDAKDPEVMKKLVTDVVDALTECSKILGIEHAFLLIVNETESGFTHLMTNVDKERVREFADVMTRHVMPDPLPAKKPTIIVPPGTILN